MLSNAYFLAKFRFDTAENEPAKNLQIFFKICQFSRPRARGELRRRNAAFKAEESTAENAAKRELEALAEEHRFLARAAHEKESWAENKEYKYH